MRVIITVTKTIDLSGREDVNDPESLSDPEIVAVVGDDLADFVDGAFWTVERT